MNARATGAQAADARGSPGDAPRSGPRRRPGGARAEPSVLREMAGLLLKIAIIAGAAVFVFSFVYGLHRNADADMEPAVKDGDLVLFYRPDKDYAAGDLLLLRFRGETAVRRVVAAAGDTVDIAENGLIVNGALQQELNIYEITPRYAEGAALPLTLRESEVFVLGDSRENATDSRVYGAVNTKDTLGTVIALIRRRNL